MNRVHQDLNFTLIHEILDASRNENEHCNHPYRALQCIFSVNTLKCSLGAEPDGLIDHCVHG